MRPLFMLCAIVATTLPAAVTIDRIVAVVGKHAIKQSDIDRDLRVTAFLNREAPDSSIPVQKKALDRLIDQELIRNDIAMSGNTSHLEAEAKDLLDQIIRDRFGNSQTQLQAELNRRNLKQPQLLEQLQWQLVVLRFIDQRFRQGVIVTDEDLKKYYDEHQADFSKTSFEAAAPKLRDTLEGEQVNKNFEDWLAQARKEAVIQYKVDSLK